MKEFEKILGHSLYQLFNKTHQFQCLFDIINEKFLLYNESMKTRMEYQDKLGLNDEIVFFYKSETEFYFTIRTIPCKMRLLLNINENVSIMELSLAHTKEFTRKSGNLLINIMDIASDGIWQFYPQTNFGYQSERFWEILGYKQENMVESESKWIDYILPSEKSKTLKLFQEFLETGKPFHHHMYYRHKQGHVVIVLCRGNIIERSPDGKPWKMMGTHTDITSIVKKDAVEAQSNFISRMSHEIRSPVCTIINECELLEMKNETKVIMDTCKQLISITDNILSLGEIGKNKDVLNIVKTDFNALLTKCAKRHRGDVKKKNLTFRTSYGDLPEYILVDVGKFNQVVDNLINNSIKYTEKGKITLEAEYDEETNICEIRICDTGIGIPDDIHDRVFEEFVQGNDTMQGTGIGLSLCKRISKLMNGDITIESSSKKGTIMLFTCELLIPKDEEEEEQEMSSDKNMHNVLIVDDIKSNRSILRRRLHNIESMGIKITNIVEAKDGLEAVEKFKQHKGKFQLVLMDCLMPIMDGFESTVQIHNACDELGIDAVPVVAVTASVSPQMHSKCYETGMKYVVTKPFSEQDLIMSIKSCFKT